MQVAQNVPTIVLKIQYIFFQISVVFYAWCDRSERKKKNLDIFDSHSKIGRLENEKKKSLKNSKTDFTQIKINFAASIKHK